MPGCHRRWSAGCACGNRPRPAELAEFADKFPAVFHVSVVGFVGTEESKYGVEFSTGRRGVNFDGDRKWGRFIGNGRGKRPAQRGDKAGEPSLGSALGETLSCYRE